MSDHDDQTSHTAQDIPHKPLIQHPANDNEMETQRALPPHSHSPDIQGCNSRVQSEEEVSSLSLTLKPLAAALGRQAAREWIEAQKAANDNNANTATDQADISSNCSNIDASSPTKDTN